MENRPRNHPTTSSLVPAAASPPRKGSPLFSTNLMQVPPKLVKPQILKPIAKKAPSGSKACPVQNKRIIPDCCSQADTRDSVEAPEDGTSIDRISIADEDDPILRNLRSLKEAEHEMQHILNSKAAAQSFYDRDVENPMIHDKKFRLMNEGGPLFFAAK